MTDRIPPYPVRMPDELRAMLEALARDNGRSLNAEIVIRLQHSIEPDRSAAGDLETRVSDLEQQLAAIRQELEALKDKRRKR